MRLVSLAVLYTVCSITGCQTVHTERTDGVPVAMWSSFNIASPQGKSQRPEVRDTVARVLGESGLHPNVDDSGVWVPEKEERRAREVLLTDKRLEGTGVIVLLAVRAGTGRKSAAGFEIAEVAPPELSRTPVTRQSR